MSGWQSDAARFRRIQAGEEVVSPPNPWERESRADRRRKIAVVVSLILMAVACLLLAANGGLHGTPEPNGSSDGRYHTCGYVTEDGVTEYLDAYLARCGDLTYGSDS